MRIICGLEELKNLAGEELGVSAWLEVTQDRVDRFAEATATTIGYIRTRLAQMRTRHLARRSRTDI